LIKDGQLSTARIGRRRLVIYASLVALVSNNSEAHSEQRYTA
jgi:hypothetical protein